MNHLNRAKKYIKIVQKAFLIAVLFAFPKLVLASTCTTATSAFIGGAQSNNAAGFVSFTCGSRIISNPNNILTTPTLTNPEECDTDTCPTENCSALGSPTGTISPGSFQMTSGAGGDVTVNTTTTIGGVNNTITDYNNVQVNKGATLNFSTSISGITTYRFSTLTVGGNGQSSTVNLQPGDYWINSLNFAGNKTIVFTVQGSGTARVFLNNAINVSQALDWNSAGSASKLLIYSYSNLNLTGTGTINALIYNQGNITFGSRKNSVTVTGAINGNQVSLTNNSTIIYDSAAVNNLDFGNAICPPPSVSKFGVSAPTIGTNCQQMTVTVTAQSSGGATVTNYTGAITITTQSGSGTWTLNSGGGTFGGGSGGVATYQFAAGDLGVASFNLSYPAGGSSPITIRAFQTSTPSAQGFSNAITFNPTSILVTAVSVANPPSSPPPAFTTPQVAGAVSSTQGPLILTAYTSSGCGIITSYSGTKTLRMYTTYVNPGSGTVSAVVNNGTSNFTIANSSAATATNVPVTFVNGVSNPNITITYSDVGSLSLNVIDTASSGPSGASGNFITRPFQFAMNIPNNAASQVTTPSAAAVSACLADTIFSKAGQPFTVNVQPQNAAGGATPNYGNETPAQGILLQSVALLAPAGGRNGSTNTGAIGNGTAFSKTTGTGVPFTGVYFTGNIFSFDEVGCINLQAGVSAGSYLGTSNVTVTQVVGRFTPDHFSVVGNIPMLTTGCSGGSGFTYLDKPFTYTTAPVLTVTAQALANSTTQNYTGSFWKLASSFSSIYNKAYNSIDTSLTTPNLTLLSTGATTTPTDNGNGTTTVSFSFSAGSAHGLQVQRQTGTLVSPFTAEIQLSIPTIKDTDNVACTGSGCVSGGFAFGATTAGNGIAFSTSKIFYQGRLFISDAVGSEILTTPPYSVPVQTQYYNTSNGNSLGFVVNTADTGCSAITSGNLVLSPSTGVNTTATIGTTTFQQGLNTINLTAPGVTGYVDIQSQLSAGKDNMPWLQFNWPYDSTSGAYTGDPMGRASFGVYQGNSRIIYQQENYQ